MTKPCPAVRATGILGALGLLLLPLAFSGLALEAADANADVQATGAWIRCLPGSLPAAGYITIHNTSNHALVLTGAASPAYARVELHQSLTTVGGEARMQRVDRVPIPAGAKVAFAPGGYHLMLLQPRRVIAPGETVDVDLALADGTTLRIPFAARSANATGP